MATRCRPAGSHTAGSGIGGRPRIALRAPARPVVVARLLQPVALSAPVLKTRQTDHLAILFGGDSGGGPEGSTDGRGLSAGRSHAGGGRRRDRRRRAASHDHGSHQARQRVAPALDASLAAGRSHDAHRIPALVVYGVCGCRRLRHAPEHIRAGCPCVLAAVSGVMAVAAHPCRRGPGGQPGGPSPVRPWRPRRQRPHDAGSDGLASRGPRRPQPIASGTASLWSRSLHRVCHPKLLSVFMAENHVAVTVRPVREESSFPTFPSSSRSLGCVRCLDGQTAVGARTLVSRLWI